MKVNNLIFFLGLGFTSLNAQIVLDGNSFLVMDDESKVVLDDRRSEAIMCTETGGVILSENENNQVVWMIGDAEGEFKIPFAKETSNGYELVPIVLKSDGSGSEEGGIAFSTFEKSGLESEVEEEFKTSVITDRVWTTKAVDYLYEPEVSVSLGEKVDAETSANLKIENGSSYRSDLGEFSPLSQQEWSLLSNKSIFDITNCALSNGSNVSLDMNLSSDNYGMTSFEIYDLQGKLIHSQSIELSSEQLNIQLMNLNLMRGIYIVNVVGLKSSTGTKLIVQ